MMRPSLLREGGIDSRRLLVRLPAVAGAALVLWAVVTLAIGSFSEGTCANTCHSMKPYAVALPGGAHASVECTSCHVSGGRFGTVADGLDMERRVFAAMRGIRPTLAPVSDDACRSCHSGMRTEVSRTGGISVRHEDFWDTACTSCHGGVAHDLDARVYAAPEMNDCLECHSASAKDARSCTTCHIGSTTGRKRRTSWSITHGANWSETHGMGGSDRCVACHEPAFCAGCHGVALPHPQSWAAGHGEGLTAVDTKACESCHDETWCTSCHIVDMPHRASFLPEHPADADRLGKQACYRCHAEESCDECHLKSAHPDIPPPSDKGGA